MSNRRNRERDREIGARICLTRLLLGMSCPELGRRLDVTGQQIRKYEIGSVRVAASTLEDLAVALEKTAIWFLETDHEAVAKAACLEMPKHAARRRQLLHAVAVLTPGVNGAPRPFAAVAEPSADGRRAP